MLPHRRLIRIRAGSICVPLIKCGPWRRVGSPSAVHLVYAGRSRFRPQSAQRLARDCRGQAVRNPLCPSVDPQLPLPSYPCRVPVHRPGPNLNYPCRSPHDFSFPSLASSVALLWHRPTFTSQEPYRPVLDLSPDQFLFLSQLVVGRRPGGFQYQRTRARARLGASTESSKSICVLGHSLRPGPARGAGPLMRRSKSSPRTAAG